MTFDDFKTVAMPTHEVVSRDLERGVTHNKAKATIMFSSAYVYETKLGDGPDATEHTFADNHVIHTLYECVCNAFSKSEIVKHMILRAYDYGVMDGPSAHNRSDEDILKAVGFDE